MEAKKLIDSGMSVSKSAELTNVPTQTLRDLVKSRVAWESSKFGPAPMLPSEFESELKGHLVQMAEYGYG